MWRAIPAASTHRWRTVGSSRPGRRGTIDAIVVDLPTADFITNVQLEGSTIVGQFDSGTPEHFGAVLSKGSALTACVNDALAGLSETGTLDTLASTWLPFQDSVPVFAP